MHQEISRPAQARTDPADATEPLAELIKARRRQVGLAADAPRWGLALSGGGIRSATFCFGLLKSLARNRVLQRFDLLSTVSGGGYIGSLVGKLYHDRRPAAASASAAPTGVAQSAADIQQAIGTAEGRWFSWWLRANGRYLIPRGTQDLLFAVATFGRNLVGVHIELALVFIALGLGLASLDLLAWAAADAVTGSSPDAAAASVGWFAQWPTPWLMLPIPAWVAVAFGGAYWVLPSDDRDKLDAWRFALVLIALAVVGSVVVRWEWLLGVGVPASLLAALLFVVSGWLAGVTIATRLAANGLDRAVARNRLTTRLAQAVTVASAIIIVGVIDYLAWYLATAAPRRQQSVGVAVIVVGVALRALLPKIAELPRGLTPTTRRWLAALFNLAGLLTLGGLVIFWVSLVHRAVTLSLFPGMGAGDLGQDGANYPAALIRLALVAVPVLLVMLSTARNVEFLNRSSLHSFYRSRLMRAYLGAGNNGRFGPTIDALSELPDTHRAPEELVSVRSVHPDDDILMKDYAPHAAGGPVHLINVCVNQTRDPRGGLFNQDRKGLILTVGPQAHARVGQDSWQQLDADSALTLSSWMAISGAAMSPGLGSSTRPGASALAMLAGVRLGYWWKLGAASDVTVGTGKYRQLLSELLGRFAGDSTSSWFLSDGGHFENTAVYALLRERCQLIVVADCGADPRYSFGDLENLVRKARIDLRAEVSFLKPSGALPPAWKYFGSLNDIVSTESAACLALARIDYAEQADPAYMIVVKPSMSSGLPVDLVNFKADNPTFPQESTTDQFFDEAQWESYYRLGCILGECIETRLLEEVPVAVSQKVFVPDDGIGGAPGKMATATTEAAAAAAAATPSPARRLPSRIVAAGAVTASLSLGAIASLVLTAWQAVETEMNQRAAASAIDKASYKELTELYSRYEIGKRTSVADRRPVLELATAIVRTGELTCTGPAAGKGYQNLPLIHAMLTQVQKDCRQPDVKDLSACKNLADDDFGSAACLAKPQRSKCMQQYWIRDYGDLDGVNNCRAGARPLPVQTVANPPQPAPASIAPTPIAAIEAPTVAVGRTTAGEDRLRASADLARTLKSTRALAGAPTANDVPAAPPLAECKGRTVYIQVYGSGMRDEGRMLRTLWRPLGASVPPIEDVWSPASLADHPRPQPVSQPTLLVHDDDSMACAQALRGAVGSRLGGGNWEVKPLPLRLKATRGVIEAWIPPTVQFKQTAE